MLEPVTGRRPWDQPGEPRAPSSLQVAVPGHHPSCPFPQATEWAPSFAPAFLAVALVVGVEGEPWDSALLLLPPLGPNTGEFLARRRYEVGAVGELGLRRRLLA